MCNFFGHKPLDLEIKLNPTPEKVGILFRICRRCQSLYFYGLDLRTTAAASSPTRSPFTDTSLIIDVTDLDQMMRAFHEIGEKMRGNLPQI